MSADGDQGEGCRGGFVEQNTFNVRRERRNGIARLFLVGELDDFTAPILQRELDALAHPGGALVLDLRDLRFIDRFGLYALSRAANYAGRDSWRLFIVNCHGAARHAFAAAGAGEINEWIADSPEGAAAGGGGP